MLPHRTVRVFVSSTFRDMHAERDHLVKEVFPALRERLDPYRVDLVDVDLRWGITEEQAADGRVLGLCLAEIEACRPYFVGLLGQRYGWVPDRVPPDDLARHRWLRDEAGKSVTELEILYGALGSEAKEARSFFYLRDPNALADVPPDRLSTYVDDDPVLAERLARLKARIQTETDQWAEYPARWDADAHDRPTNSLGRLVDLNTFGERVLEDLWTAIRADLDLPEAPPRDAYASPLDRERDVQDRFIDGRLTGVSREVRADTQAALLDYALGDVPPDEPVRPLLLAGPAGSGKSTALSLLVRTLTPDPNAPSSDAPGGGWPLVVARFAGASAASTSLREVLTQTLDVLNLSYGARPGRGQGDLPDLVRALREAFEAVPNGERVVLVVDAVNQFDEGETAERLGWLPATLPPTVRVVLSAIDRDANGVPTVALRSAEARARLLPLGPLTDDERRTIARDVPAIAAKTLDDRLLDQLLANPATRNPLFLRVALEELRSSALYETLDKQIAGLPVPNAGDEAAPLEALFGQVLQRVEQDFDAALVREALGLLSAARRGLTEAELRDLTAGLRDADDLFPVLRQLRPYLMRRGTVTDFFHRSLWKAARARYAPDEAARQADHARLADYFSAQPDYLDGDAREVPNARRADELFTHLMAAERWDDLVALFQTFDYLQARTDLGDPAGLVADLARASDALPRRIAERDVLRVLSRAVGHDIGFLRRHPEALFQQLWNRAWWWDAPECTNFLEPAVEGRAPWLQALPNVSALVERWQASVRGPWLRALRPPGDLHTAPHIVLRGHATSVVSVVWSSNGTRLATASSDGAARVWDAASGTETAVFRGHVDKVHSVAWSPDGTRLATASGDGTVWVWDVATGAETAVLRGHEGPVHSAAWSPDGGRIASASEDRTARLWDVVTGVETAVLRGHGGPVRSVAWSPDGARLATASGDGTARAWDAETGAEAFTFQGHKRPVEVLAWSPDGGRIASASDGLFGNAAVQVWDAFAGAEIAVLCGHETFVYSIAWSPDGTRLATTSYDRTARVWDAVTGAEILPPLKHRGSVRSVAWSPDGARLATASRDDTARVWDAETGTENAVLRGHEGWVESVAWSPDGTRLATASYDGTARVWDAEFDAGVAILRGHKGNVCAIAWSPDGTRLATASRDGTARVWEAETGAEDAVLRGHQDALISVAWSPDGARLVTTSWDDTARAWNAATGAETASLRGHQRAVHSAAWSPGGARLATASYDGTARVWNAATGAEDAVLRGHKDAVSTVVWSPDGTRLGTISEDGTARVWNTNTGAETAVLCDPEGKVSTIAWSPDGARLATASYDGTARVWDVATGAEIHKPGSASEARHLLAQEEQSAEFALTADKFGGETRVFRAEHNQPLAYLSALLDLKPTPAPNPVLAACNGINIYVYRLEHIIC